MPADTIDPFDNVPFASTPPKMSDVVEFYINDEKNKVFVGKINETLSDGYFIEPATGYENKFPPDCRHGFIRVSNNCIIRKL